MTTRCLSLGLNGYRGGGKTEKGKSWDLMLAQMKKLVWNATVCLIIVINIISMLTRPKLSSAQRPWLFLAFKRSNLCLTYVWLYQTEWPHESWEETITIGWNCFDTFRTLLSCCLTSNTCQIRPRQHWWPGTGSLDSKAEYSRLGDVTSALWRYRNGKSEDTFSVCPWKSQVFL